MNVKVWLIVVTIYGKHGTTVEYPCAFFSEAKARQEVMAMMEIRARLGTANETVTIEETMMYIDGLEKSEG